MNRYTAIACFMLSLTATLSHAAPTSQSLRVDINSEGRKDMGFTVSEEARLPNDTGLKLKISNGAILARDQ